jgi:threonyl-tRNA synthetase
MESKKEEKSQLFKIRHSLAHIMAVGVLQKYPDAKVTIGPVVDNGFYYDMDFGEDTVSDKDIKVFTKNMKKLVSQNLDFSVYEVSKQEALEKFSNNEYKTELIESIAKEGENITIYKTSKTKEDGTEKVVFEDLCEGPHIKNTSEISTDAFKLTKVAGAYWRGDEKNKMLTRIYGIAFETKEQLDEYEEMMAEAEKRDHRKIGKELELFTFSPLVGSGLPLWTPKGTILRNEIDRYVQELRSEYGYQKVTIPHITKEELYKVSGHYDKFAEELFRIKSREGRNYFMKPVNCPHHTQIFAGFPKTYKDMPQRYSETTMVYRDEQSGELGGLSRVLSITQDDSHVFCAEEQIKGEVNRVFDIVDKFYPHFGLELKVRLSFHDPEKMEKYLGTKQI